MLRFAISSGAPGARVPRAHPAHHNSRAHSPPICRVAEPNSLPPRNTNASTGARPRRDIGKERRGCCPRGLRPPAGGKTGTIGGRRHHRKTGPRLAEGASRDRRRIDRRSWRAIRSGCRIQHHVRRLFTDHNRRRIGIARCQCRHDRGIGDPRPRSRWSKAVFTGIVAIRRSRPPPNQAATRSFPATARFVADSLLEGAGFEPSVPRPDTDLSDADAP